MEEAPPFVQALKGRKSGPSSPVSKTLRLTASLSRNDSMEKQREIEELERQISELTKENDQIPVLKGQLTAKREAAARRAREHDFLMASLAEEEEKVKAISEQIKQIQGLIECKQSIIDAKTAAIDSLQKEYMSLQDSYKAALSDLEVQRMNNQPRQRPPPLVVQQEYSTDFTTYDMPKPDFQIEPEYTEHDSFEQAPYQEDVPFDGYQDRMRMEPEIRMFTDYVRLPSPVHAALRDSITFQDEPLVASDDHLVETMNLTVAEMSAQLAKLEKQKEEMEMKLRRSPPRCMSLAQSRREKMQTEEQLSFVNQNINRLRLALRMKR